jgi:hypothetical protein
MGVLCHTYSRLLGSNSKVGEGQTLSTPKMDKPKKKKKEGGRNINSDPLNVSRIVIISI